MQSTDKPASTIRQRGRKSASRLAFPDDVMMRPQPPESLTVEEKVIWMEIVEALRADWFRGASTLIAETRQLLTCIAQQEPCSEHWLKLVSVQRTVSMSAAALATKLRLTPRSQFDRNQPKLDAGSGPDLRPWEDQCN
jgi:hypothetical protein